MRRRLTGPQARRVALAAQGFGDPRPAPWTTTTRHLQRVVERVGAVQVDSVNVLVRSHYLPFFSRLGRYDRSLLDRARDVAPRRLVEYWAHEASLVTPATWPLLDFRMRRAGDGSWGGMQQVARHHPELVEAVCREVATRGPLTARQVEVALAHDLPRSRAEWGWNWSLVKHALEHLFWAGRISSAGRTRQFERRYASLADVAPPRVRRAWLDPAARPPEEEAVVELVRVAARALGIATQRCLRDYFRLSVAQAGMAVERLVSTGELIPAEVEGWHRPTWLYAGARVPRRLHAEALLSPFDSLVWQRERTEALFGFRYRIEIYTPPERRTHGYYVLPFLYGDQLVARCDLKADRAARVLRVHRVTWEPGAPVAAREALDRALAETAEWLGLGSVTLHSPPPPPPGPPSPPPPGPAAPASADEGG